MQIVRSGQDAINRVVRPDANGRVWIKRDLEDYLFTSIYQSDWQINVDGWVSNLPGAAVLTVVSGALICEADTVQGGQRSLAEKSIPANPGVLYRIKTHIGTVDANPEEISRYRCNRTALSGNQNTYFNNNGVLTPGALLINDFTADTAAFFINIGWSDQANIGDQMEILSVEVLEHIL